MANHQNKAHYVWVEDRPGEWKQVVSLGMTREHAELVRVLFEALFRGRVFVTSQSEPRSLVWGDRKAS